MPAGVGPDLETPCCAACERPCFHTGRVVRAALMYCSERCATRGSREQAEIAERRARAIRLKEEALLEVSRAYAFGAAGGQDVLNAARDFALTEREENAKP